MEPGKRKRETSKNNIPRKRVAIDVPKGQKSVKVSFLQDDGDLGPLVAFTPGLSLPSTIALDPYKKQAKRLRDSELILQSSAHPKLNYIAAAEKVDNSDGPMDDYIGVYDPATGNLQLIEARKLVVRTTLHKEVEEMRKLREDANSRAARANTRYELGLEFGSARTVKAITARTQNIISPQDRKDGSNDPAAKAVLNSVSSITAGMPTQEMMQAAIDENKPRPWPNLEATNPAEVYPLETLLPPGTLAAIEVKDWIDAIAADQDVKVPSFYVSKRLKALAQTKQTKKLKILRYILLLLSFNGSLKSKGRGPKLSLPREELVKRLEVSAPVVDAMLRKFAAGREMSKWHTDHLATHVCALALFVDDYEVDIFDLHRDLNVETRQIQQYFQEIGCRVNATTETQRLKQGFTKAEAASHRFAKLKIPPTFPKTRSRARAGARR